MAGMVLGENEEKIQITSVQKHDGDLVLLISGDAVMTLQPYPRWR